MNVIAATDRPVKAAVYGVHAEKLKQKLTFLISTGGHKLALSAAENSGAPFLLVSGRVEVGWPNHYNNALSYPACPVFHIGWKDPRRRPEERRQLEKKLSIHIIRNVETCALRSLERREVGGSALSLAICYWRICPLLVHGVVISRREMS